MKAFERPEKLVQKGLRIGGTKYELTQVEEEDVINGQKGTSGIVVKKTNQALLVGIYDKPMTLALCNAIVKRVGSYIIEQHY
ncbi:hypothetical protein SASPL_131165 [Salvia splendens]|uniref:Pollen allergen Ole e 2 n=1 Tax=Salvia splendens TaxID=180675 RepID=A0A8X8ZKD0_SALSN|nr:hypothetical protein SASPL_131165 [Salvia splendens]